MTAPYVLLQKAAELTGYTVKAMERKIERGEWVEGREWVKAPDCSPDSSPERRSPQPQPARTETA